MQDFYDIHMNSELLPPLQPKKCIKSKQWFRSSTKFVSTLFHNSIQQQPCISVWKVWHWKKPHQNFPQSKLN